MFKQIPIKIVVPIIVITWILSIVSALAIVSSGLITGPAGPTGATGKTGETGATGPAGPAGAKGSVWWNGTSVPASSLGSNGDYYLNLSNGDVYNKISGTWTKVGNIKGPTGVSNYWISGILNTVSRDVTTTFIKIDNFLTFTKESGTSVIEVMLASRATGGTFSGATGVQFEARIDDQVTTMANRGAITATDTIDFITINAIYTNIAAGTHTVSVWARANTGSSSGVILDPGNWGGRIIVKES